MFNAFTEESWQWKFDKIILLIIQIKFVSVE